MYVPRGVQSGAIKDGPSAGPCKHLHTILRAILCLSVVHFASGAFLGHLGSVHWGLFLYAIFSVALVDRETPAAQFQLILGDYFKVHTFTADTAQMATALIARKIFNRIQGEFTKDRFGVVLILAYLVANLARWMTHCIAFMRLFRPEEPPQLAVMAHRGAIIAAQVGAAKGAEKIAFTEEAERFCNMIMDKTFWSSLELLIEDIEPICYGTKINQKDSSLADQVLLSLVGMFLPLVEHPEPEVAAGMTARLEKRWKDSDQPLFLLALILNPFEKLSCFGPNAGLNYFKCLDLIALVRTCHFFFDPPSHPRKKNFDICRDVN
ncbi:hypothetical protein C8R44DRAFT_749063 [Mycena epipterygia]|nr:hypothetical protein C8R44DRAFT_749063 [Mycena epipterygia]